MFILNEVLKQLFAEHNDPSAPDFPNLEDALTALKRYPVFGRAANWKISAMRALSTLCEQECFLYDDPKNRLEDLLNNPVVLELESMADADKLFFTTAVFAWIFHYRLAKNQRDQFDHCIFIEEAHHLLAKGTRNAHSTSVLNSMLRECRELSQSICLLDQQPSEISKTALANTGTTIALSSKEKSDMGALANTMLLSNKDAEVLGRLPLGMAVVKTARYSEPFMISFADFPITKNITDQKIYKHMAERIGRPMRHKMEDQLPKPQMELLADVEKHPDGPVTGRYRRLELSARKGDAAKTALLERGLIVESEITSGSVRIKELRLTAKAKSLLNSATDRSNDAAERPDFIPNKP